MLDNFNKSHSKFKEKPKGKGKGEIFNQTQEIKSLIDHLANTNILPLNLHYETYISLKEKLNKYAETYKESNMCNYVNYCLLLLIRSNKKYNNSVFHKSTSLIVISFFK
jgi:hypothetical protein